MTRFALYDTNKQVRDVQADIEVAHMQMFLSEFRTHCAVEGKAYEFNHFKNWLKRYKDLELKYQEVTPAMRVDM